MTLAEKREEIAAALARSRNAAERLTWLVERAEQRPRLDPVARTEGHLVPGCLSKLWLVAECLEGHCRFACDSDSRVVRAVAGLLCELATDCTPEELLAAGSDGPVGLGLDRFLAPNRRATQTRVWERILAFAAAQTAESSRRSNDETQ